LVEKFFPTGWSAGRRKQVGYIDIAPANNSSMAQNFFGHNPLKRPPHSPYSPDISPSDFSLFGKAKRALTGQETLDEIDLLELVIEIVHGISDAELQRVFRS
jgi:hypothetical protein